MTFPPHFCPLQVAEMHGELIEFNERLYRSLMAKDHLIVQMRQELIDLRGPVSAKPRPLSAATYSPLNLLLHSFVYVLHVNVSFPPWGDFISAHSAVCSSVGGDKGS